MSTKSAFRRHATVLGIVVALGSAGAVLATPSFATTGKVVYDSESAGNWEVYVANSDGTGVNDLSNAPGLDFEPQWSPDGSHIAFVSDRSGVEAIWQMAADGSAPTQLTTAGRDYQPTYSPDGASIAFVRNAGAAWQLWVMNADGTNAHQVQDATASLTDAYEPAWLDLTHVVFTHQGVGDTNPNIYSVATDGTSLTRLTDDSCDFWDVTVSPNRDQLAFDGCYTAVNSKLFTLPVAGGTPALVDTGVAGWDTTPRWQDSVSLVYVHTPSDPAIVNPLGSLNVLDLNTGISTPSSVNGSAIMNGTFWAQPAAPSFSAASATASSPVTAQLSARVVSTSTSLRTVSVRMVSSTGKALAKQTVTVQRMTSAGQRVTVARVVTSSTGVATVRVARGSYVFSHFRSAQAKTCGVRLVVR